MKLDKFSTYLGCGILVLLVFLLFESGNWWMLQISGITSDEKYVDLFTTYELSKCQSQPCNGFIYGHFLYYLLHPLNLSKVSIILLGNLLTLAMLSLFVFISVRLKFWYSRFAFVMVCLSPPGQLLLERMNIDIVVFLLTYVALYNSRNHLKSLATLALLGSIKFYSLFTVWLYIVYLISRGKHKSRLILSNKWLILLVFAIYSIYLLMQFFGISERYTSLYLSWGLPIWGMYGEALWGPGLKANTVTNLSYLALFACIVFWGFKIYFQRLRFQRNLRRLSQSKWFDSGNNLALLGLFVTGVGCYLFSINYDYRLLFLTIPACFFGAKYRIKGLVPLALVCSWCSATTFGLSSTIFLPELQVLGDIAIGLLIWRLISVALGKLIRTGIEDVTFGLG